VSLTPLGKFLHFLSGSELEREPEREPEPGSAIRHRSRSDGLQTKNETKDRIRLRHLEWNLESSRRPRMVVLAGSNIGISVRYQNHENKKTSGI